MGWYFYFIPMRSSRDVRKPYVKEVLNRAEEFSSAVPKIITDIYELACEYFGEDKVALDVGFRSYNIDSILSEYDCSITYTSSEDDIETTTQGLGNFWSPYAVVIHYPEAVIENEYGHNTLLRDLFVRVPLDKTGKIASSFRFIRATYTKSELEIGYMHSHCQSITNPSEWKLPCLGTGPIRNTMTSLMVNPDLITYRAFFWELDKMVHVESLAGVPYLKLDGVISPSTRLEKTTHCPNTNMYDIIKMHRQALFHFIKSYLSTTRLKLAYDGKMIILGEPFVEWLVSFTQYMKKYALVAIDKAQDNSFMLMFHSFAQEFIVKDNTLFTVRETSRARRLSTYTGMPIIVFKGIPFTFNMVNSEDRTRENVVYLIHPSIGYYIVASLINYLNIAFDYDTENYGEDNITAVGC